MTDNTKTVEAVARAIVNAQGWAWGLDFDTCREDDREHALEVAKAAIAAHTAALKEPTAAMVVAGGKTVINLYRKHPDTIANEVWKAMIEAAGKE